MKIEESIGARIRAERERQGMTLDGLGSEMAHYLGKPWTPQAIWQAEHGKRDFRAAQLLAFALALDVPVVQLLAPVPGQDDALRLSDEFELTTDATEMLFAAVGTPGVGPALLDISMKLEDVDEALIAAAKATHEQGQIVFTAANELLAVIASAQHSEQAQARLRSAGARKSVAS